MGIPVPGLEPAPPTVLIVDDEDVLRRIMARVLMDAGYRVLVAGDGAAAWEMVPLATLPAPPPVVLISGYAQNQHQIDVPFLRKPFRPTELVAMVAQVLAG